MKTQNFCQWIIYSVSFNLNLLWHSLGVRNYKKKKKERNSAFLSLSLYIYFKCLFMYLAVPSLVTAWGNSDLVVAGEMWDLLVSALGIFSYRMRALTCIMWDLVPWPGIELRPPALEAWVLATDPPGKSLYMCVYIDNLKHPETDKFESWFFSQYGYS